MLFNTSLKCYTFTKATFSLIRISFTESTSGIQPSNLDLLSKCPRIPITLVGKDGEQKQPRSRSPKKNLILISLLQDYRHGIEHSNNMPVQFGFSLFRVYISPIYQPLIVCCFSPVFRQFIGPIMSHGGPAPPPHPTFFHSKHFSY